MKPISNVIRDYKNRELDRSIDLNAMEIISVTSYGKPHYTYERREINRSNAKSHGID